MHVVFFAQFYVKLYGANKNIAEHFCCWSMNVFSLSLSFSRFRGELKRGWRRGKRALGFFNCRSPWKIKKQDLLETCFETVVENFLSKKLQEIAKNCKILQSYFFFFLPHFSSLFYFLPQKEEKRRRKHLQ